MTIDLGSSDVRLAQNAVAHAVAAALPFTGRGAEAKQALDEDAARAIASVLAAGDTAARPKLVSCEGARDGAWTPSTGSPGSADHGPFVYCDPIDGTLNAARGGPRGFSVLALGYQAPTWHCGLDDAFSVLSVGSRTRESSGLFDAPGNWVDRLSRCVSDPGTLVGTLNRQDNLQLLEALGGPSMDRYRIGSSSGYRPTLSAPGVLAVGDATVGLALEADCEIGRIGLVEAQIQSAMHVGWTGLLVSRDVIKASPGGIVEYIDAYLTARDRGGERALAALFNANELRCFAKLGVDLRTATQPLDRRTFGAGEDGIVVIGTLSAIEAADGTARPEAAPLQVGPRWDSGRGVLQVECVAASSGESCRSSVPVSALVTSHLPLSTRDWYVRRMRTPSHDNGKKDS